MDPSVCVYELSSTLLFCSRDPSITEFRKGKKRLSGIGMFNIGLRLRPRPGATTSFNDGRFSLIARSYLEL